MAIEPMAQRPGARYAVRDGLLFRDRAYHKSLDGVRFCTPCGGWRRGLADTAKMQVGRGAAIPMVLAGLLVLDLFLRESP